MNGFEAFRVHKKDKNINGKVETVSISELSEGDVIIKSAYSAINYKDALAATGKGKIIRNFPRVPGIDVAGYIVSSKNKLFKEGDPVIVTGYELGTDHDGGYSEYVRVPAKWVVKLPEKMSLLDSMILGTAGFTVALSIKRMEENGQKPDMGPIVVTGATGGVGCLAIDILAAKGYEVVALTGKMENSEDLKKLGANKILDRNNIEIINLPLANGQWGGALDNVGGNILSWLTKTVKPWGNIASIGLAGGSQLETTVMPFILRGVSLLGINSSGCPTCFRQSLWNRLADDLKPHNLEKIHSKTVSMTELNDVFIDMLAGKTNGRTVVAINP